MKRDETKAEIVQIRKIRSEATDRSNSVSQPNYQNHSMRKSYLLGYSLFSRQELNGRRSHFRSSYYFTKIVQFYEYGSNFSILEMSQNGSVHFPHELAWNW